MGFFQGRPWDSGETGLWGGSSPRGLGVPVSSFPSRPFRVGNGHLNSLLSPEPRHRSSKVRTRNQKLPRGSAARHVDHPSSPRAAPKPSGQTQRTLIASRAGPGFPGCPAPRVSPPLCSLLSSVLFLLSSFASSVPGCSYASQQPLHSQLCPEADSRNHTAPPLVRPKAPR